ncbi:wall-associated receptor kinase 2-like protein [Tanacetum coccineum]
MFTVIGCDDFAVITGTEEDDFSVGCFGICSKAPKVSVGECSGKGCCQTSITEDLTLFNISLLDVSNHSDVWDFNPCGYAFLSEEHSFEYRGASDLFDGLDFVKRTESTVPLVLDWVIARNRSCSEATECKGNSSCHEADGGGGNRCRCNQGYEGNPYLDQGCQGLFLVFY